MFGEGGVEEGGQLIGEIECGECDGGCVLPCLQGQVGDSAERAEEMGCEDGGWWHCRYCWTRSMAIEISMRSSIGHFLCTKPHSAYQSWGAGLSPIQSTVLCAFNGEQPRLRQP